MTIRNDLFAKYLDFEGKFWKIENNNYRIQFRKEENLPKNFNDYNNLELEEYLYKDVKAIEIKSAYKVSTFCNYKNGLYYFENIWKEIVILSPELETKKKLGLHIYDDRRIEIDYNKFINNVEEIWEERTPIEGFKFDVEPIVYLKRKNID